MIGIKTSAIASYKRLDTDASAFITAAALTSLTHKAAANQMVINLKSAAIWAKCVAIYPFIGGTAAAHKFNLKNPVNTDAANRILFTNLAHDNTGVIYSSGTSYADLRYNSANFSLTNSHLSLCAHNNGNLASSSIAEMGAQLGSTVTSRIVLALRVANNHIFDSFNSTTGQGRVVNANNNTTGVFGIGSRTAANASAYYKGDMISGSDYAFSPIATITTSGGTQPNENLYINGYNPTNTVNVARTYTFASFGTGLTAVEAESLYKIVRSTQITLARLAA